MDPRKEKLLDTIRAFAHQRPGLEFANYGDWQLYRSEMRAITKDLHDYRAVESAVRWRDSITADDIISASRSAFSGRLTIEETEKGFRLEYCTGQYFPTEYRKAATSVLAQALWYATREDMPKGTLVHNSETGETFERYDGLRAGDWLSRQFRREFGRGLASRYFN